MDMPDSPASSWVIDDRLKRLVREAQRVSVLTGAGISAESGIPTFRGDEGLWKQFRPEELASMDGFLANPRIVWEWYRFRRDVIGGAQPNDGHLALARWESLIPGFTLITQNVDGLHTRAGNRNLIELHGNLWRDRCLECGRTVEASEEVISGQAELPECNCGGRLRPDVVWFGEMLPEDEWRRADEAASLCDLFLAVGTSAVVHPAAGLPRLAKTRGAVLVEINPEATPLSGWADYTLFGPAGQVLPELLELVGT